MINKIKMKRELPVDFQDGGCMIETSHDKIIKITYFTG